MHDIERHALAFLGQAGYFPNAEARAFAEQDTERHGLEAALLGPGAPHSIALDAEDLVEGGAGMGIQQVRALLGRRGINIEAADSETVDGSGHAKHLLVNGTEHLLLDWSFAKRPMPDDLAAMELEAPLRDLLWKSRVQGHELLVRPCEHGSDGVDLHIALPHGTRFIAHWGYGFDDGRVLHAINFFTLVNRLLQELGMSKRFYAWHPFTNEQAGVLLDDTFHELLQGLGLADHLRRIDAMAA